jgi:ribosomal protein L11 methylase PrmA
MPKYISWIPTQNENIDTLSDIVYDLGSGDGRLLFAAVEKGAAKCVGIDIDHRMVEVSRQTAKKKGMDRILTFIEADITAVELSLASVIFCYLHSAASAVLKPKFEKELKAGTRIVMESFPIMGWKPDKVVDDNGTMFYFYVMPAQKTDDYMSMVGTPSYEGRDVVQFRS